MLTRNRSELVCSTASSSAWDFTRKRPSTGSGLLPLKKQRVQFFNPGYNISDLTLTPACTRTLNNICCNIVAPSRGYHRPFTSKAGQDIYDVTEYGAARLGLFQSVQRAAEDLLELDVQLVQPQLIHLEAGVEAQQPCKKIKWSDSLGSIPPLFCLITLDAALQVAVEPQSLDAPTWQALQKVTVPQRSIMIFHACLTTAVPKQQQPVNYLQGYIFPQSTKKLPLYKQSAATVPVPKLADQQEQHDEDCGGATSQQNNEALIALLLLENSGSPPQSIAQDPEVQAEHHKHEKLKQQAKQLYLKELGKTAAELKAFIALQNSKTK